MKAKSEQSHAEKMQNKKQTVSVDVDPAFNYSCQALNSLELAREKMRKMLSEQDPDAR